MYYSDKTETLKDIFGSDGLRLENDRLIVNDRTYPIVDDVIILLDPSQYPEPLKKKLRSADAASADRQSDFAEDIQFTFSEEWQKFPEILDEYANEFKQYFDIMNISGMSGSRVCDLGCGIGRWSYFLKDKCRELVLVDFSEAIFVARRNLRGADNAIFFMCDLKRLPFKDGFADLLFCLGVLHHLPTDALNEVRALKKYARTLLIYLYYALDNRPFYFRAMLYAVTMLRGLTAGSKNRSFRSSFTWAAGILVYLPFVLLGKTLRPFGLSRYVPLYETYNNKGLERIRQDVYDRFFTRIEQRVSRKDILTLNDTFSKVTISNGRPYWHFICER